MNDKELQDLTHQYTRQILQAALSTDPTKGFNNSTTALKEHHLAPDELLHINAGTVGILASLIDHLIPEGTHRTQFVHRLETITTLTELEQAIQSLPRAVRRTNRKKNK